MRYLYVALLLVLIMFLFGSDIHTKHTVQSRNALPAAVKEATTSKPEEMFVADDNDASIEVSEQGRVVNDLPAPLEQIEQLAVASTLQRVREEARLFIDEDVIPAGIFRVTKVIDGDTIEVATDAGVRRVRYIGIDTPETVHPSRPVECFGREASLKNKELVEGKWVRLMKDVSDTDRYGRWLRYVYVDDEFVNLALVAGGYASTFTYPPDVRFSNLFLEAERAAREQRLGLWGTLCENWVPSSPAAVVPSTSQQPPQANCTIKGNINSQGDRIYHVQGCKSYGQTVITEETGEQWFCTEADAVAAGWRKAGNCP